MRPRWRLRTTAATRRPSSAAAPTPRRNRRPRASQPSIAERRGAGRRGARGVTSGASGGRGSGGTAVTVSGGQQPRIRRERRIIERPRLIKLLDESEAQIILLLAPAGYGKTTLARQWAKSLNGAIWVSLTPAHRDVARLAEDIATGIDALGGQAGKFVGEYLRSRGNPQRAARDVAAVLSEHLAKTRVQWLLLDDFHELQNSSEAEEVVAYLQESARWRTFVTSRVRPTWATPR